MEPDATEQGVNLKVMSVLTQHHKSVTLEMTLNPGVTELMPVIMMIQTAWHICVFQPSKYINAPVPPKWKHNDHILEEYKKFLHSCQRIFDGLMAHVTSGKVKTNMFLIWCGPEGEDIYDNF